MQGIESLAGQLAHDPVLAYSLLAAAFLALVSMAAGLSRLDLLALANPRAALACIMCVAAAILLNLLIHGGFEGGGRFPLLAGVERLPLLLAALAYGPGPGVAVAGLYAAFASQGGYPGTAEAVLALELLIVGWLAIYPSPRDYRWAGSFGALLGHGLAQATAGLAAARWQQPEAAAGLTLEATAAGVPGLALTALLLLAFPPTVYRQLFPHSRIVEGDDEDQPAVIEPLLRRRLQRSRELAEPVAPPAIRRLRGRRRPD